MLEETTTAKDLTSTLLSLGVVVAYKLLTLLVNHQKSKINMTEPVFDEKLNQGLKISHKIQLYFTDMTNDEEPIVDAYAIGCQSKEQAQLAYNTLVSHMQLLTIKTPKNG